MPKVVKDKKRSKRASSPPKKDESLIGTILALKDVLKKMNASIQNLGDDIRQSSTEVKEALNEIQFTMCETECHQQQRSEKLNETLESLGDCVTDSIDMVASNVADI